MANPRVRSGLLAVLSILLSISVAAPLVYEVHERSSHSLQAVKRLEPDTVLPVRIFLKQKNIAEGELHLLDIANPSSPNYGQHWTADQVTKYFEADNDAVRGIQEWFDQTGVDWNRVTYSRNRGIVAFSASAAEAEELFQSESHHYYDASHGLHSRGFAEYSLPIHLRDSIDFVSTSSKPGSLNRRSTDHTKRDVKPFIRPVVPAVTNDLANCSNGVFPECISTLYKIPPTSGAVQEGNTMGILNDYEGGLGEFYAQVDLDRFYTKYFPNIPNGTNPIQAGINGAAVETDDVHKEGGEAMLDYSMAFPIVYPQNITAFINPEGFSPQQGHLGVEAFFDAIDQSYCESTGANKNASLDCGKFKPTNVISISYGHVEYQIDYNYAVRTCNELMKLGLQGTTVLVASADYDVYGNGVCTPNRVFTPDWLAACPWALTVGGTQIPSGADVRDGNIEVSWQQGTAIGSGGGFSNYFAMPDYQNSTVNSYLADTPLNFTSYAQFTNQSSTTGSNLGDGTGKFNRLGRAYPDVSALSGNLSVFTGGLTALAAGTSAGTPIWGAVINRINEERLRAGKKTVGFVNPTLYQNPDALNDITSGSNAGACGPGFPATKGWDPVTGLGSPDYEKLLNLFLSLP